MENIVIVGIGNAAEVIYSFVLKYNLYNVLGFAVNKRYKTTDSFLGKPIYELETLDKIIDKTNDRLFVAIQWNNLNADRRRVFEQLKSEGYTFGNLIAPTAVINGTVEGTNCWIADYSIVDFGAIVKDNVYIKGGALVANNAYLESHCYIGAKATVAGGVKVGEQSFIGLGAIIFDDTTVGKKCIVGAATALKRNLPDFSVYKTSSDSSVMKTYEEEVIESKLQFRKNIR